MSRVSKENYYLDIAQTGFCARHLPAPEIRRNHRQK